MGEVDVTAPLSISSRIENGGAIRREEYKHSDKESEVVSQVYALFRESADDRNRSFAYFDNRTLTEYIEDSVRRFYTNIDERDGIDEWQSILHDPFTRNKLLAILGRVVDALPVAEITGRGDQNAMKGEIIGALFEYSEDVSDSDQFMVDLIEDAMVKGTAVGYEGIETTTKKRRVVIDYKNGDDLVVKERTVRTRKLISALVPLEEFYPSSVGIRRIKDMPYAFWRTELSLAKFLKEYQNYEKAEYVCGYQSATEGSESVARPYYQDFITPTTTDGNVEVIKYFNQETDEYIIVANGVWLNPLKGDIVSPLPFNHKALPFFEVRYDNYGIDFFYGKSFPDRISVLQDTLNVLHNMLLDQSFLTIFSPILIAGVDDIEDDFLVPGRRITIDTQGLPVRDVYQKMDLGTPNGWHQWIMQYTKQVLEESSIDSVSQGSAGVGGRTTATEIRSAAAGLTSLLGLFGRFIKFGVKERARLRVENILQFYFDEKNPISDHVLSQKQKEDPNIFNSFYVNSGAATPGDRGEKIIDVYKRGANLPTNTDNQINAKVDEVLSGRKVTRFTITPEFFDDWEACIKIVPNTQSEMSKDVDRALELQFQQAFLGLYPDLANRKALASTLAEKFGRDPSKVIMEQQPQGPQLLGPDGQPIQSQGSMMPNGGGDNSANVVKGETGVGGEGIDLRALMGGS